MPWGRGLGKPFLMKIRDEGRVVLGVNFCCEAQTLVGVKWNCGCGSVKVKACRVRRFAG